MESRAVSSRLCKEHMNIAYSPSCCLIITLLPFKSTGLLKFTVYILEIKSTLKCMAVKEYNCIKAAKLEIKIIAYSYRLLLTLQYV